MEYYFSWLGWLILKGFLRIELIVSDFQPFQRQSNHSTSFNGALSQCQQDLVWGKMEAYLMLRFRKLLTVSESLSYILAVLLCMCFVPLIPVWLITADSEGWTVQLTLTSMVLTCRNILLISVVPLNHVVSYGKEIVGASCQIPNHTKSLKICTTSYWI